MASRLSGGAKPRITLTAVDHERLTQLATAATDTFPEVAAELADELARARVLAKGRHLADTVRMGSEVLFRDETTGRETTVTLVYPQDADIAQGRISILTPVGTALIGLSVGQSINWTTRGGDVKRLTVQAVREPAQAEVLPG
ncbi:nucleoside diphosphate kinase regulator [Bosea sp. (in: a-proteobacteria)]|jgi:regulator of nucleoside diphosphate kinase|uniref:nucleoside diphosphate kinase regulator n=1 Tax=Bosea sp. (in: a-proteobacteria) TaxID=1871050 RepID=UPI003F714E34